MARSYLGNKKDGNHIEIKLHFEKWDCSVLDLSSLPNCCDMAVSRHGRTIYLEVKDGSKPPSQRKLTDGEIKFKAETKGAWRLCESIVDADKIIAELNSTDPIYLR